jgi:hypothetical protein
LEQKDALLEAANKVTTMMMNGSEKDMQIVYDL